MTTEEFSTGFDILYNNVSSNKAPGLDEYEKSVILTKAEKELVKDYFNNKTVKTGDGFDANQKRQYDFSTLMSTVKLQCITPLIDTFNSSLKGDEGNYPQVSTFDDRSLLFLAPSDLFLSINESIVDTNKRRYSVLPISYSEYNKLMLKPYGFPLKRQAWRLISDSSNTLGEYTSYSYSLDDQGKERKFTMLFRSRSTKDIELSITTSVDSDPFNPPGIVEEINRVKIYFEIPLKGMTNYWSKYLKDEKAIKEAGLAPYFYPFDGKGNGIWTSEIKYGKKYTIKIPSYRTSNGDSIPIPIFEVIGRFPSDSIEYTMRYVKTPKPIILVDLSEVQEGLSIDGYSQVTECELPANMHEEILQRAVELAKATYQGDLNSIIQTGNISGTELGYQVKQ